MVSAKDIIGAELKYKIEIIAGGFSMEEDNFEVVLKCGSKKRTITKDQMVNDEQGNFYIVVDTNGFKPGDLFAFTYAYVPDHDCPDGLRTEVDKYKLTTLTY